jgi:hypothetical protein
MMYRVINYPFEQRGESRRKRNINDGGRGMIRS